MNDEAARQGRPATVNDHLLLTIAAPAACNRCASCGCPIVEPLIEPIVDERRWLEQVDRVVSAVERKRRTGDWHRFELPPSLRSAA
jgi:hypothetical protein